MLLRRRCCRSCSVPLPCVSFPPDLRISVIRPNPTFLMFYLTTAIDYTNGSPHIGHAYEKILTDVIARYRRLRGDEVYFLTGVDQHGQKVQQTAEKEGISPEEFVERTTEKFSALWGKTPSEL